MRDPRADALEVLQTAFSGLASDLGIEVREKRGLVYYVGAYHRAPQQPGQFVFYAGTEETSVPELERLLAEQIERVTRQGLREEERIRAVRQIISNHYQERQDNSGLALSCALNELYGLGYDYPFTLEQRMQAVTLDTVRDAAASIFQPNRNVISVVYPLNQKPGKRSSP